MHTSRAPMTTVNVMHGHTVRTEAKSPTETSVEFDGVAVGTYPPEPRLPLDRDLR